MESTTGLISPAKEADYERIKSRVTWVVALGVLFNPLNSSMISVALLKIGAHYEINITTATWLISSFFLAATIGQPLMGKLGDLFGPRRVFCIGMAMVAVSCLLTLWAPSFGWLLVLRIVQALGTSCAYPVGMSIIRSVSQTEGSDSGKSSASSIGLISITANVMAALGPTLGGMLVTHAGWNSIFWINVPLALLVFILTLKYIPADKKSTPSTERKSALSWLDIPGIVLFSVMFVSFMFFLVTLGKGTQWWLLIVAPIVAVFFVLWELRTEKPFLDVKMLLSNIRLTSIFAQFTGLNIIFYSIFFGLPMWLGRIGGYDSQMTGIIMLPFVGMGVLSTPVAIRMIQRSSYRQPIIVGNMLLVIGTLLLLLLEPRTPIWLIVSIAAVIGIPNGMNNLGLSTAIYSNTRPEETGVASGLFQTFRSVGSLFSTSLIGLIFSGAVTTSGLHTIVIVSALIGVMLLAVSCSRKITG